MNTAHSCLNTELHHPAPDALNICSTGPLLLLQRTDQGPSHQPVNGQPAETWRKCVVLEKQTVESVGPFRVAKRTYAKKLEDQFTSNDSASVWKGLKAITKYRTPSPSTEVNQQLAEDLNEFYCRFETPPLLTISLHNR